MYLDKLSTILGRPAVIEPPPLTLSYPARGLRAEGIKGALGLALCLGILLALRPAALIAWPLAGAALLFAYYAGQQVLRRSLRFELDGSGLSRVMGSRRRRLDWSGLEELRLHFYPHRRRSLQGSLLLTLRSREVRFKLDSSLEHFATLLQHAGAASRERELIVDSITGANLAELGL